MKNLIIKVNENIELATLHTSDAEELFAVVDMSRAHLGEYLPWVKHTNSPVDSLSFINSVGYKTLFDEKFPLKILLNGTIVGMMGFHLGNESIQEIEIGYWLAVNQTGKGIVTQCVEAEVKFLEEHSNIRTVVIRCREDNKKSGAIPLRLGFKQVKSLDEHLRFEKKLRA